MIFVMNQRGRVIRKLGSRGGGDHPGEFRLPSQVVVFGNEPYVSDPVLNQIQVFGHEGQKLYIFDPSTIKGTNFSHPSGMWVDAGRYLYAVDSQSNRVR